MTKKILYFLVAIFCLLSCGNMALAEDYQSEYEAVSFDTSPGLKSLEINAVAQTGEGYIWAGGYSGLYRYDGVNFTEINLDSKIGNVMALYTDSKNRLWIGTNDNGVACYNPATSKITLFTIDNGLSSNAIRSICEDSEGNLYIGTVGFLSVITPEERVITYGNLTDITCVRTMSYAENGVLAGVTNSGTVFFMKGDEIIYSVNMAVENGIYYTSCCAKRNGEFLVGDSAGSVYQMRLSLDEGAVETEVLCKDIGVGSISCMTCDNSRNGYLICADNGLGYLDAGGSFTDLRMIKFNGSVCNALQDKQGNFWFVSNKQGIMKLSKNPFVDVFKKANLTNHIVNAVAAFEDDLYIGCDDGLIVLDCSTYQQRKYKFLSFLQNVRVRHLYKDSQENLWISTYGKDGLVCLSKKHEVTCYNEGNAGTMGGRFRSVIELKDHTILAASSTGLTYIKGGKVIATIGEKDGLVMPQILTMLEREDGTVLAGSDGDGIYLIQNQKVIDKIGQKAGMDSLVILRIIKCGEGYVYITSNSIYYDRDGKITKLDQFPYNNNYDIYVSSENEVWISSSAGIYIVDEKDFLENKSYHYILLNQNRGFDTTLSANAWNYVDEAGHYYLCCSTGVKMVSITDYDKFGCDYNLMINQIIVDNAMQLEEIDGEFVIPAGANRIVIKPAVLSFTLENPIVHMYLEGFDHSGMTVFQNDLTEMIYTNLPYGNYEFHMQILNEKTREVEKEVVIPIKKEAQFFEYTFFKAYLIVVICFVAIFITWLLSKYGSITVIKRQYEEIRLAKEEADYANHAKSQFLANMSHEIRTPINTIMGMNELVLREEITPTVRRHSRDIQNASTSLLSIVNDILDFSKIESGKMNIVSEEYVTEDLLMELSTMLQVKAQEKNLKTEIVFDERIPSRLFGDVTRIRQVVLNLLSNAVKYTEKGSIAFSVKLHQTHENKAYIEVSVKDTGIGIRKEDVPKLFHTFERLDEKRNAHIQGTGLGLNITKELLALMGSELKLESTYGKGSNFRFLLEQEIIDGKKVGNIETNRESKDIVKAYVPQFVAPEVQILVIDDNDMNLKVVQGLLAATKVQIDTGISGKECLEKIRARHYDLILLDHMMPEMDGIETLERIKNGDNLCKETPIIVLTANAILGVRETYLEKGFTDYLSKPVTGDALETVLAMYLPREKMMSRSNPMDKNSNIDNESIDTIHAVAEQGATVSEVFLVEEDGLKYSGGMIDLYHKMLQMFEEQGDEKIQEMNRLFGERDWKNYTIFVHALKGNAKGIGANSLSKKAEGLEKAGKSEDEMYIQEHHAEVMELYQKIMEKIRQMDL